jgi:hypothetical protein
MASTLSRYEPLLLDVSGTFSDDSPLYLRHPFTAYTLDKHLFMSYALQEIRSLGYQFVASVPLARRGPLSMGSRREVLVFKDMMSKSGQR